MGRWPELARATILIVDDDEASTILLTRALAGAGCERILRAEDPDGALETYRGARPDLVVLDFRLGPDDGLDLMDRIRAVDPEDRPVPILMLTGHVSERLKQHALERGADDFLTKETETAEIILRARNLLQRRNLTEQLHAERAGLEEIVKLRTRELQEARREVVERLALAAEYRDDDTGEHTRRVGRLSALIAAAMGEGPTFVETIGQAALLHDLGKIGIPDAILLKPARLTDAEFELVRRHPDIGAQILAGTTGTLLRMAREIALTHHERWNGEGYPRGLAGSAIPLSGRIAAVADVFDAMSHARPYKAAIPHAEARAFICEQAGVLFDPRVVEAFAAVAADGEPDGEPLGAVGLR